MLRVLIGTGLLLMAVGFGAASWQYWQGLPPAEPQAKASDGGDMSSVDQLWMVTATGAIVPEADMRAYLTQDRLVPERLARMTVTGRLDSLLVQGEKLPAAAYLEVLADIRAPQVAQTLCPILMAGFAQTCMVRSARVVPGSVDALRGEARFSVELGFRQAVDAAALPDLAAHVLEIESVQPDPAVLPAPASVEAALTELVTTTLAACGAEERATSCRVLGLTLDWAPGSARQASARIAWLAALPEGMTTLAPIRLQPEE
jgi:hypothetical protein